MQIQIDITKGVKGDLEYSVEPETSRIRRQRRMGCTARRYQRERRLDYYYSQNPPNGTTANIFRQTVQHFKSPGWLEWDWMNASIDRLQRKNTLTVTRTTDSFGRMSFSSTSSAKQRVLRDSRTTELIEKFRVDIDNRLQEPIFNLENIHGCRLLPSSGNWRVRFFICGRTHTLGTYRYETAIRLFDAATYFFRAYRAVPIFNISAEAAATIIETTPVLKQFLSDLESHWKNIKVIFIRAEVVSVGQQLQQLEKRIEQLEKAYENT